MIVLVMIFQKLKNNMVILIVTNFEKLLPIELDTQNVKRNGNLVEWIKLITILKKNYFWIRV